MITEDQSRIESFLSQSSTFGLAGEPVRRVETHGAMVFLAGERAYKLKRAVFFDYMDYSTAERRRAMCEAEVRLNRRTAPGIYRRAVAITRDAAGALALGGDGEPVDWLVEMNRFDEDTLFDRMAGRGALTPALMDGLADAIVRFHGAAERRSDVGGAQAMRRVLEIDTAGLNAYAGQVFDADKVAEVTAGSQDSLEGNAGLLDRRGRAGFVRHLHGDLHLRNICLFDGRPTIFDTIEFNDEIAVCDVLYDFAFLVMDLHHRGLRHLSNVVFNDYIWRTNDHEGLALLPMFLSFRAAVRAHVGAATADSQSDPARAHAIRDEARAYLDLAIAFLKPRPARLIAIGGLSGSGKSTLAQNLAHAVGSAPGAVILRSDIVRKRLTGAEPTARLGPEAYTSDVSQRVYEKLCADAGRALTGGHSAIIDAVLSRTEDRAHVAAVARDSAAAFDGMWLKAPAGALERRLIERQGDASDATPEVLRSQLKEGSGAVDWPVFDVSGDAAAVRKAAADVLVVSLSD